MQPALNCRQEAAPYLGNDPRLQLAEAIKKSESGWCFGISMTFMRYCNAADTRPIIPIPSNNPLAVADYENFLIEQFDKLLIGGANPAYLGLSVPQVESLIVNQIQGNLINSINTGPHRGIFGFWNYDHITSCYWNPDERCFYMFFAGHAIAVDLTRNMQGACFIFDANFGLFKAEHRSSNYGIDLVKPFIAAAYPQYSIERHDERVARQMCMVLGHWWQTNFNGAVNAEAELGLFCAAHQIRRDLAPSATEAEITDALCRLPGFDINRIRSYGEEYVRNLVEHGMIRYRTRPVGVNPMRLCSESSVADSVEIGRRAAQSMNIAG